MAKHATDENQSSLAVSPTDMKNAPLKKKLLMTYENGQDPDVRESAAAITNGQTRRSRQVALLAVSAHDISIQAVADAEEDD